MRRVLALTAISLALAGPEVAVAQPVFVIEGNGWGHGVGMPQYGTSGFARQGWTYDRILAYYYPGTELGPAPAKRIRVLLAAGRSALDIGSEAPFTVRDASGTTALPAGSYHLGLDLTLSAEGEARTLVAPVRFVPGKRPLELERPYRGAIVVSIQNGKLAAVNDVKLEPYVKGVVAGEMPPDWELEALKVQAVAARSYALASRRTTSYFDVFSDTRSQVYGGVDAEHPRTNRAVGATKGQVLLYDGEVAWTFFSASSGGKTAAIEDAFAGAEPLPYLVSVEDPFDDISPYHRWGPLTLTAEEFAAKLGSRVSGEILAIDETLNPSGRVAKVTITATGGQVELTGSELRSLLGLRSTWFTIVAPGELSVSADRIVYGKKVTLSGIAPGSAEVVLEHRPQGKRWSVLGHVVVVDGAFELTVKPTRATSYRARLLGTVGAAVRVAVAPRVAIQRNKRTQALVGLTRPKLPGAPIRIERLGPSGWVAASTSVVGRAGRFVAKLELVPGAYRARVLATAGFATGVSPPLTILPA